MRIISGKYRGKRISPPQKLRSRPTTDFAKEGIFNVLTHSMNLSDIKVLDLFAGTGNISYEFVSRGAELVWSVDSNPKCARFISQFTRDNNIDGIKSVRADVYRFLKTCAVQFDLVYADPPYGHSHVATIPEKVFDSGVLIDDGLLIVEHGIETDFSDSPYLRDQRKYGNVNFSLFRR